MTNERNDSTQYSKRLIILNLIEIALIAIIFGTCLWIYMNDKNIIAGIICMLSAIGFYIYYYFKSHNLLNYQGVFLLSWWGCIGLAMLRLLGYQSKWSNKTLLIYYLASLIFMFGLILGKFVFNKFYNNLIINKKKTRIDYELRANRIFWIVIISAIIAIGCFACSYFIKGFIPIFSTSPKAYVDFYTKFHIFEVATIACCGLGYYCIKKTSISKSKKFFLYLSIVIIVMILPIISVSRGILVCGFVILAPSVYFYSKKRALALFLLIIIGIGCFGLCTQKRNLSNEDLTYFFQPITEPTKSIIQLSPKEAFVYSYLTVGFDNLDVNIKNFNAFANGAYQLKPFNVILRNKNIDNILDNMFKNIKEVSEGLNTFGLIAAPYFDFGMKGVFIFMLIWSFAFGIIESYFLKYKGACSSVVYGITLIPVALTFFDSWMSVFTTWMWWGTAGIYFIILYLNFKRKHEFYKE